MAEFFEGVDVALGVVREMDQGEGGAVPSSKVSKIGQVCLGNQIVAEGDARLADVGQVGRCRQEGGNAVVLWNAITTRR